MKIGITGHREKYFNESQKEFIKNNIEEYVLKNVENTFLVGGCNGVDNWFGDSCIKNKVNFILYLPYWNGEKIEFGLSKPDFIERVYEQITRDKFTDEQVEQLYGIYSQSKEIKTFNGFQERDRAIADDCDQLYCGMLFEKREDGKFSGTGYTVNRCRELYDKAIYNIITGERLK